MARRSRKPPGGACAARRELEKDGFNFSKDFFDLSSSAVDDLLAYAKLYKYRKSKNAPGSTARMYYQYLKRAKCGR